MYDPLEPYRLPKQHDFVVQECTPLDVRAVICWLTDEQYRTLSSITLENGLELVAKRCGAARRWHFLCPSCSRACEHLYLLPGESGEPSAAVAPPEWGHGALSPEVLSAAEQEGGWYAIVARAIAREQARQSGQGRPQNVVRLPYLPVGNWRCRKCLNLNYGSQHFGRTHALRRQLPPRRALTRRRRLKEANRKRNYEE
jgi:hypothetical protein